MRGDKADVVLLDVPCSNTGVFAKRVQSRWRWPTLDQKALAELQMKLLAQGAGLLAPGGVLMYATCSIDRAENEGRVEAFLKEMPGMKVVREERTLPSQGGEVKARRDGGYVAFLRGS